MQDSEGEGFAWLFNRKAILHEEVWRKKAKVKCIKIVKRLCFWINPLSRKSHNSHSINYQQVILILICFYCSTLNGCRRRTVTTEYVILTMFNSLPSYMFCNYCGMLTHTTAFISIHGHQIRWSYCTTSLSYLIVSVRVWPGAVTRSLSSVSAETIYVHSGFVLGSCLIHKAISMRRRSVK
jgi:hypothetical protein